MNNIITTVKQYIVDKVIDFTISNNSYFKIIKNELFDNDTLTIELNPRLKHINIITKDNKISIIGDLKLRSTSHISIDSYRGLWLNSSHFHSSTDAMGQAFLKANQPKDVLSVKYPSLTPREKILIRKNALKKKSIKCKGNCNGNCSH